MNIYRPIPKEITTGIIIDIKKPTKGIKARMKVMEESSSALGMPIIL
jgi:hypothetical protein